MEVKYLFIDGGCLRETLNDYSNSFFDNDVIDFDYGKLSREFHKIFYYDSPPPQKSDENDSDYLLRIQPQLDFFTKLNLLDGFHIYEGTSRRRRKKNEQKKVDIMIAVDMLNHSFRKNMTKATLLTSDLDFKPLIDALVENGMYINLWYPLNKTNIELIQSADSSIKLDLKTLYEYTTTEFQKSHKIPKGSDKIGKDVPLLTKIEVVKNSNGIEGEFYKANDRVMHFLLIKTKYNDNAYTYFSFEDLNKLKLFFEEYSYSNK